MTSALLAHVRVVVADDAALLRFAVTDLLTSAGATVVGQAADGQVLRDLVAREQPQLVVTDIRMPPGPIEGLAAAIDIQQRHPATAILLLSNHAETSYLQQLLNHARAGVGYVLKERIAETDDFLQVARRVVDGRTWVDPEVAHLLVTRTAHSGPGRALTVREREVLAALATGASNTAIARQLHVSIKTVETHIPRIFDKLGLYDDGDINRRVRAVLTFLHNRRHLP